VSVVVVSNRVARAKTDEPVAGGLAAALLPMVEQSGATWVGTNVPADDAVQSRECFAAVEPLGNGALATIDLPARHYRNYYEGFANSALWPALHSRPDLIQVTAEEYASYREVNACMARGLLRFNDAQTVYWIQDYHFLTLGAELRQLRIERPIGFFLHTPWAERGTMLAVPHHADLVQAMLAYDLIGFQTDEDQRNFEDYVQI
jgi:trehalose 6-phosphate synthase